MASNAPLSKVRGPTHPKKKKRKSELPTDKHPFTLAEQMEDSFELPAKDRSAKARKRQESERYVAPAMSNKILLEARKQQLEMEKERDEDTGTVAARQAFASVLSGRIDGLSSDDDDEDEGFSDTQSQYEEIDELPEEEERILAMFMADKPCPQRTLADLIMDKIHEKDAALAAAGGRPIPAVDSRIVEVYRGVAKLLSRFRSGKMPKAFKILPSLSNWEEIVYLTEPYNWTANAMYQATRIFASNLNAKMAQRFYNLVLLPRIREDIRSNKRLHFALYQALKKAVYKPSAFFKGILLPLCQSRTCNLRETVIIGSVIQKVSIPSLHSSVALLKIAEMEYCGTNSYFMKILLDKKYALPYRVLDAVSAHFMRFIEDERTMPVIWHQCLLSFIQRYKNELRVEDKDNLDRLIRHHKHYLVTPEIRRELQLSQNRGQKEVDVIMSDASRISVVKATIDEDIWNLPEVPQGMEE